MSEPEDEPVIEDTPAEAAADEPPAGPHDPPAEELERIVEKISTEHGFDVRGYKRTTLYRRIRKRMGDARCADVEDYLLRLETVPQEYGELVDTILINVTEFFRDPDTWDYFQQECLAPLVAERTPWEPVRAWSVGCATGEEAYSLAICLAELTAGTDRPVKVYATDMDEGALAVARAGIYNADDLQNVSAARRERFFEEMPGGRYRVRRDVRQSVIFGQHNALEDAPISRLDALVCRNLLIYFDSETQQQLLRRFNYALREHGYLFLGKAETLLSRSLIFHPVEPRHRIFQRSARQAAAGQGAEGGKVRLNIRRTELPPAAAPAEQPTFSLDVAPDPVLVLDFNGTLLAANAAAREVYGISDRTLGRNLLDLDEGVRPPALRLAIEEARTTGRIARVEELTLMRLNGRGAVLNVEVRPQPDGVELLVWGRDITREHQMVAELTQMRQELETAGEELQTTNEELETTNEELQSTNEELETTNEELQSTNEELETTIEELQSTNEELEAANDELRARQDELHERDRFQSMVLSSLEAGLVVVRNDGRVASWNRICEDLWGVRAEEAVGQDLFTLDTGMPFEELRDVISLGMQGRRVEQPVEVAAINRRGRPIRCHVRIHPLLETVDRPVGALLCIETEAAR